jgi:hypothetical protein
VIRHSHLPQNLDRVIGTGAAGENKEKPGCQASYSSNGRLPTPRHVACINSFV